MNVFSVKCMLTLCINIIPLAKAISPALILTPFINEHRGNEARNLSTVDSNLFLNVTSHSGFVTVDEKHGSNTFFWYFPVPDKPLNETPWIIWLQGGPGASSIAGIFDEIGPFEYLKSNKSLKMREHSWTKEYSVLFLDNPVGAGFSFTNNENGFVRDIDTCADHLYSALQQFLTVFPELREAPLYIAGESYAGRYIPTFAKRIVDAKPSGEMAINLQGIIMGSPVLNRENVVNHTSIYYQWGLIDSQGRLAAKKLQDAYSKAVERGDSDDAYIKRNKLLDILDNIAFQSNFYNILKGYEEYDAFTEYITRMEVKEALHVGEIKFTFSNQSVQHNLISETLYKPRAMVEALLEHYRILIYCGQLDAMIPCVPNMQARRDHWHWNGREAFLRAPRIPWWFNETVAGYVKSGGQFTEALVKDAGHLTPMDKPAEVLQLVSYFIRGLDMPRPPNYQINKEYTPDYVPEYTAASSKDAGLIASVIINVFLVIGIIIAVIYFLRWRRRNEGYLFCATDDAISDGILSLA